MSLSTDPIDIELDNDHDISFVDGDIVLTSGINGVAQDIDIAVKMIAGEWFQDLDEGIALWVRDGIGPDRAILGQKFNKQKAINEYSTAILTVREVTSILSLDVTFDSSIRTLRIRYEVITSFGDTVADSLEIGGSDG